MADITDRPEVYRVIAAVAADLARGGIAKERQNAQQGFMFRGIDDVYNALAPILAQHGLCILPRYGERETVERTTSKGGALFYTVVRGEFMFVAAADGSSHTVVTYGEAMDTGDKATNKAMSAALKYACLQTFMIPTEGDNDADATTHEIAPTTQAPTTQAQKTEGGSDKQRAMAWALAKKMWGEEAEPQLRATCRRHGLPETFAEMTRAQASSLIMHLQKLEEVMP